MKRGDLCARICVMCFRLSTQKSGGYKAVLLLFLISQQNKGDSKAGRGSILTHESHGPARVIPEAQSSSLGRNKGLPTAGYFQDESLGRERRSSEAGSGSARSLATVPGSQCCSGMDQGCWPELKTAAELLGQPFTGYICNAA